MGSARARRPGERGGQVAEQPRPAQAAAADDDAGAAGLGDHAQRVVGLPDVAVAEHRDVDGLDQPGDVRPVGGAAVELVGGAAVQGDRRGALVLRRPAGVEVGDVVGVDADAGLDGDRDVPRRARRPTARCRGSSTRRQGSAEPPPLRVTLGTGQPKFRSMCAGRVPATPSSTSISTARPTVAGSTP